MRHHDTILTELHKLWKDHIDGRRTDHHIIFDGGQLLDTERDRYLRIDERGKLVRNLSVFYLNRTDLNDLVDLRAESGCLNIKNNIFIIQRLIAAVRDNIL